MSGLYGDARLPQRFWAKVADPDPATGCWTWTAAISTGYGRFGIRRGKVVLAHRLCYQVLVADVPAGLHLDHLCRNRACVNPKHLEPVTPKVNILRGVGPSAKHATKTHCPNGHPYDDANTYSHKGIRQCRACRAIEAAKSRARRAAQVSADPSDSAHGTTTGYCTYQCRCDRCRSAWREYQRDYRQRSIEARGSRAA